jgi:ferredoxin
LRAARRTMRGEVAEKLENARAEATALRRRVGHLQRRLERLADRHRRRAHAVVERSRCTGCGLCERLCPAGAIRMTYVARVDAGRCTGCGVCVENCPQAAIHVAAGPGTPAWGPRNA